MVEPEPEWVTKTEAAKILKVSRPTLDKLIKDGHLTTYLPIGMSRLRLKRQELMELAAQAVTPRR